MSINTDLNVDPYFDDFDADKQYHRILFKPARAVQARELTQMQTILQNQIERFGSNIYKDGTIVTGINITTRTDLFYVKLVDQENFTDPEAYKQTEDERFELVGASSGLRAEIVEASNGFQTREPDLKTFYIRYKNSAQVNGEEVKQFIAGETLSIRNILDQEVLSVNVATTLNGDHVGRSYGVSVDEGVIFQKGHFIYVEPQTTIVSKYTQRPTNSSVGFEITESLINSGIDQTLLDPASGYNNENAPGADRLQLKPTLVSYLSNNAPDDFFALIRFDRGQAISIRDVTQFNSINETMARRTYDESGNYVARGMKVNVTKEQELDENNNSVINTYAVVGAGKAYSFGQEVNLLANRYLNLSPSTNTIIKNNQGFGVNYQAYFGYDNTDANTMNNFVLDGSRYTLFDENGDGIGTCSIRNITPDRIYVYAIIKSANELNTAVSRIGLSYATATPVTTTLVGSTKGSYIIDIGNRSLKTISDVSFTRRKRIALDNVSSVTLDNTDTYTVLTTDNMVAIDAGNSFVEVTSITSTGDGVQVAFASPVAFLYHDVLESQSLPDTLSQINVYMKSSINAAGKAALGLPNVVNLLEVFTLVDQDDGSGNTIQVPDVNVTSQFRLVRNQKDSYYGLSYLQLKSGEAQGFDSNTPLRIRVTALRRTSTSGNGYITADSYLNVDKELVASYTQRDGTPIDLFSAMDFRPYAQPGIAYAVGSAAPPTASEPSLTFVSNTKMPPDQTTIVADLENYLDRRDVVAIDRLGKFRIIEGASAENPVLPNTTNVMALSELFVPGGEIIKLDGPNPLNTKSVSTPGYTMSEIEKIDKTVKRLRETVSLTLLEMDTQNLLITDANGNERFKNGIIVDSFKNLDIAEVTDPQYRTAIDKTYTVGTPAVTQFPIDMTYQSGQNVSSSNANTTFANVITLQPENETGTIFLEQQYATNFRNAASNQYGFKGRAIISPQYDSGYNVVDNPAVNIDVDIATPLLDLVDNIQEFVPLTRSSSSSTSSRNSVRVAGGTRVTTSSRTTTVTNTLEGTADTEATDIVAGDFITDFEFRPYMQSREVRVLITGLRPNTIHSFFFDENNVNEHVVGGTNGLVTNANGTQTYDVTAINPLVQSRTPDTNGNYVGITSDSNGVLTAIFTIPEETFFVGETELLIADVDQFDSFNSGRTSYARSVYRAYNFGVNKTELSFTTRSVDFDVETNVTTSTNTSSRFIADPPPVPRSCFVAGTIVSLANGVKKKIEEVEIGDSLLGQDGATNKVLEFDHPMLGGRDLFGINESGPFMTPEHPVFTKDGWKAPRMANTLQAYPHLESIMVGDLEVGDEILTETGDYIVVETIECHSGEPDQRVYNFILDGNNTYHADGLLVHNRDPLSQTFFVKSGMADGASNIYMSEIDLFFKRKSETNGITVQVREVVNGYPSYTTLPFGSKYINPTQISVSDNGSLATTVHFDNPIKLDVEKEYCFVIIPEQIDPNYLLFTSKVGGTDLASGAVIAQDWGDGVLFTSTNDRAWRSYQDEDVKFRLRKYEFTEEAGYADLRANNSEFFTITSTQGKFRNDELVYGEKIQEYTEVGIVERNNNGIGQIAITASSTVFAINDYVLLVQGDNTFLGKVTNTDTATINGNATVYIYTSAITLPEDATNAISAYLVPAGRVSYYNSRNQTKLYLRESSSRANCFFSGSTTVTGYRSGAQATITSVDNIPLSYMQPMLATDNTLQSQVDLNLLNGSTIERSIPFNDATYLTNSTRYVESKSNVASGQTTEKFRIRVGMQNNGFTSVTPILDEEMSMINAYQYQITNNPDTSSQYISKEVVLQPDMDAVGLKVLLSAYRPAGTMVDVYARFTYEFNPDEPSDWLQLTNASPDLYSNTNNIRDYREFEYNFDETTTGHGEYTAFQIRIVMRHMDVDDINAAGLLSFLDDNGQFNPEVNLFPHIYDYRAIALT